MKTSKDTLAPPPPNADPKVDPESNKPPNPETFRSLEIYDALKQQLYEHFFDARPLSIDKKNFSDSYTRPYQLMNGSTNVIANDKKFQNMEVTFINVYKQDLTAFARKIYSERLALGRGLQADEFIVLVAKWVNIYARFNHWIFRTFLFIERNAMRAQGIKLYFEGIRILKA
jgi:hypothetical protein